MAGGSEKSSGDMRDLLIAVDHHNVPSEFSLKQLSSSTATALKVALPWLKKHGYIVETGQGTRLRITAKGHRFMGQSFVHEDAGDDAQQDTPSPKKEENGPGE